RYLPAIKGLHVSWYVSVIHKRFTPETSGRHKCPLHHRPQVHLPLHHCVSWLLAFTACAICWRPWHPAMRVSLKSWCWTAFTTTPCVALPNCVLVAVWMPSLLPVPMVSSCASISTCLSCSSNQTALISCKALWARPLDQGELRWSAMGRLQLSCWPSISVLNWAWRYGHIATRSRLSAAWMNYRPWGGKLSWRLVWWGIWHELGGLRACCCIHRAQYVKPSVPPSILHASRGRSQPAGKSSTPYWVNLRMA